MRWMLWLLLVSALGWSDRAANAGDRSRDPTRHRESVSESGITQVLHRSQQARLDSLPRIPVNEGDLTTGGLVAAALTDIAGSSDVFDRGFVTYSNRAKQEMLGVPGDLIADLGAVSEPVARMMCLPTRVSSPTVIS